MPSTTAPCTHHGAPASRPRSGSSSAVSHRLSSREAEGNDGGVVEYGFLDEQPDIHGSFRNASVRDTGSLDKFEVLVHHQHPCFFGIEILHFGEHIVVDGKGRPQIWTISYLVKGTTLPQLTGCKYGNRFRGSHTFVVGEFFDCHLAESIEIVVAVFHDVFHQIYCALVLGAGTY